MLFLAFLSAGTFVLVETVLCLLLLLCCVFVLEINDDDDDDDDDVTVPTTILHGQPVNMVPAVIT